MKSLLGFHDPGTFFGYLNLGKRGICRSSYYLCLIEGVKDCAVAATLQLT
jgi:hypothetical protein